MLDPALKRRQVEGLPNMSLPIPALVPLLRASLPAPAIVTHPSLVTPERCDMADVRSGERLINVLWTVAEGITITEIFEDSVFDDFRGVIVESVDEALQYILSLLEDHQSQH